MREAVSNPTVVRETKRAGGARRSGAAARCATCQRGRSGAARWGAPRGRLLVRGAPLFSRKNTSSRVQPRRERGAAAAAAASLSGQLRYTTTSRMKREN